MANDTVKCPDDGTCHHECMATCFRAKYCAPLSGVYPNDEWPLSVQLIPTPITIDEGEHDD